jgi:lanosterol synthase
MFLLPCVVIAWYVTETPISWAYRTEIKNYLFNRANEDGGWGLHIEGPTTVLGTILNYITMRIVGVEADHPNMAKARGALHKLGGGTCSPHWGKAWMAILGIANWDIVNPVPAELWILPDWVPFAPWRWWIHIRMIFLPLSYLYSKRWIMPETELIRELRKELFVEAWEGIDWAANRNTIADIDNYTPKTSILNILNFVLANIWRPIRPTWIKDRAEDWVSQLIDMEDENTDYSDLAPVSGPMNAVVVYVRDGKDSETLQRHRERFHEYLFMTPEGLLASGTNGVQCWDTSFALQAIVDAGLHTDKRWRPMLLKALGYLDNQQIRENVKNQKKCYRQQRKGGWAFSNKTQGYAVSDCISEALKAIIMLQKTPSFPTILEDQRIFDAVDTLLTYQNPNGAVSSYEPRRAGEWMEVLNAAEVFGRIMVEYDYPECTTAVVTALSLFRKHWPDYRTQEIKRFLDRAVAWIKTDQKKDGSWYGSWGICFTYAGMFALESLASYGETYQTSEHSRRGCDFFIAKQRADGGWSESFQVSAARTALPSVSTSHANPLDLQACEQNKWIEHPSGSLVVQTAWALIALMQAEYPDVEPIKRGIKLIMERQQPNGEWLQEAIAGVFNKTCAISYPNYKFYFPIKAMGMFASRWPEERVV